MTTPPSKRMMTLGIDIATGSAAEAGTVMRDDIIVAGAMIVKKGRPTEGAVGVEAEGSTVIESAAPVRRGRDIILLAMMIEDGIDDDVGCIGRPSPYLYKYWVTSLDYP